MDRRLYLSIYLIYLSKSTRLIRRREDLSLSRSLSCTNGESFSLLSPFQTQRKKLLSSITCSLFLGSRSLCPAGSRVRLRFGAMARSSFLCEREKERGQEAKQHRQQRHRQGAGKRKKGKTSQKANSRQIRNCFRSKMLKKQVVLLCFRSKMLKKHWFYCVFAQKC